jgi:hypothetical protein
MIHKTMSRTDLFRAPDAAGSKAPDKAGVPANSADGNVRIELFTWP